MVGVITSAPATGYAQGGPLADIQNQLTTISTQLNQLATLAAQLEALQQQTALAAKAADQYVPFKVQIPGGLCDSGPSPSSNPAIVIDSDGTDPFVVTSILVRRGVMNPVDFMFLSLNTVRINGTGFDTRAGNLLHPIGGEFAVLQAVDLLGTPVRPRLDDERVGGNVPHQIVADGDGPEDIHVRLFCRSDLQDMNLDTVLVAGWKKPAASIAVSYVPGQ
jgi:hypothetical protein